MDTMKKRDLSSSDWIDAIRKRTSCRTFRDTPLSDELLGSLKAFARSTGKGPFGNPVRFRILDLTKSGREEMRELSTYGFIRGARYFLAGVIEHGSRSMEDLGYCTEKVILAATVLGLGTCWVGGTFSRAKFARKMDLKSEEHLPAVIPFGFPAERRSLSETAVRTLAGSNRRKPWRELFFNEAGQGPLDPGSCGPYSRVLECVRLAPSASNRQPWRIRKAEDGFHLFVRRTPGYDKFSAISLQDIDMGIAMCHFELAAGQLQLGGGWSSGKGPEPEGLEFVAAWRTQPRTQAGSAP